MSRFVDPVSGTDVFADALGPELDEFDGRADAGAHSGTDGPVTETGTTTVGLATDDGVVVATDRRASLGGRFVSNKSVRKVEQVHPTAVATLVGSVGGAQSFVRTLRAEADLYETRHGDPMSVHALATLAGNFARGGPFLAINPILAGVDDEGAHVYSVDPAGGVMADDYTVTGSGMALAYGTLEGAYDRSMTLPDARNLAVRAVEAASERDAGSGNGVTVATVTEDGVDVESFADPAEAAAPR